jgi:hypothetical protein
MGLQIRQGTDAQRLTITPQSGELIYTIDTGFVYVGDGVKVTLQLADKTVILEPRTAVTYYDYDSEPYKQLKEYIKSKTDKFTDFDNYIHTIKPVRGDTPIKIERITKKIEFQSDINYIVSGFLTNVPAILPIRKINALETSGCNFTISPWQLLDNKGKYTEDTINDSRWKIINDRFGLKIDLNEFEQIIL